MLKRLGRVIWWVGMMLLLFGGSHLSKALRLTYEARGGAHVQADLANIQGKEAALLAHFAPKPPPAGMPPWTWALDADAALKYNGAPLSVRQTYLALNNQEESISKAADSLHRIHDDEEDQFSRALLFSVAGLFAWTFAYILGGSFWKPPPSA